VWLTVSFLLRFASSAPSSPASAPPDDQDVGKRLRDKGRLTAGIKGKFMNRLVPDASSLRKAFLWPEASPLAVSE